MPALPSRTSTHKVLELCFEHKTKDSAKRTKILNSPGPSRRVLDVQRMIHHLESIGIIGNPDGEELATPRENKSRELYSKRHICSKGDVRTLNKTWIDDSPFFKSSKQAP